MIARGIEFGTSPLDVFYKAGAGGFVIYVVPSLDVVIYKMAGSDSSYDPASTGLPELYKYDSDANRAISSSSRQGRFRLLSGGCDAEVIWLQYEPHRNPM